MPFLFRKLDVYRRAIDLAGRADRMASSMKRGHRHLADQLARAGISVPANIAEGNGRFIGMVVSTLTDANGNLINVAHAVPATAVAKFLCSETQCDPQWVPIAQAGVDSCDQMASQ